MSSFTRAACFLALFLGIAFSAFSAPEPDPEALKIDLDEFEQYYFRPAAEKPAEPPQPTWLALPDETAALLRWEKPVASAEGLRRYDLSQAPRKLYWWNYPLYGIFGFPRDLIDGFYGVVGKIPPFSLLLTGLGYEVLPVQILTRPWKDWHRWPGLPNKNGHGWIAPPNGWGFFPNWANTKFRPVNQKTLDAWTAHNAEVDRRVARQNAGIVATNRQTEERRTAYLAAAARLYDRGQYQEAVAQLWAYLQADPRHRQAKAMLIASLVAILPNIAERDWAERVLQRQLHTSPNAVLVAVKEELTKIAERNPANKSTLYYLIWTNTQLRAHGEAYKTADRLVQADPANLQWLKLRFETALRTNAKAWMDASADALENATGAGSVAARHARGRIALAQEHYATAIGIYRDLRRREPGNPRFHYLYGMALLREGIKTGIYDRREAVRALREAARCARSAGERAEYEKATRAAEEIVVHPPASPS